MGWMNAEEQRHSKKKTSINAQYMCDECHEPIRSGEVPVVDPKGGYYPWPANLPENAKPFLSRNPKVTYHLQCDRIRRGVRVKEKPDKKHHMGEALRSALEAVKGMIQSKPKTGYWTKEKCCQKLKEEHDKKYVLRAIRELRSAKQLKKKHGGYYFAN